jgi:hypothetical protein
VESRGSSVKRRTKSIQCYGNSRAQQHHHRNKPKVNENKEKINLISKRITSTAQVWEPPSISPFKAG